LEPASLHMLRKLVVSLVSTIATWMASNGSMLWTTAKTTWVPAILRLLLSKESHEVFDKTVETVLRRSSQTMETATRIVESYEWTKTDTYKKFLSAWSSYYDGGMVVVFTVLTLLLCRLIMMCTSFRKRNERSNRNSNRSSGRSRSDSRASAYETPSGKSKPRTHKQKEHRSTKKHSNSSRGKDSTNKIPSEENVPKLLEESSPNHSSTNRRATNLEHSTASSPSVVSLED